MTDFHITQHKIILTDFAHPVSIGIHDFEKAAPQRMLFTIELGLDLSIDADDITQTLDYDFLRAEIKALTTGRHFNLQETLAREILDICFQNPQVLNARIALAKPDVYEDCRAVGYTIEAQKA